MRNLRKCRVGVVAALGALCCTPVRADEKGDELLRQVKVTVQALEPLIGEYDVTFRSKASSETGKYQQSIVFGGRARGGNGRLPPEAFDLFDPITQVPATTRYLGRQTVAGETYEVVELRQPRFAFRLLIGSDGLIHRAFSLPPVADKIEIVVTSYRKPRAFAPRLPLPPPDYRFKFLNLDRSNKRFPFHFAPSPDGSRLLVVFTDNSAQIVDGRQGQVLVTLEGMVSAASVVFAPDGKRVAIGASEGTLVLYDAATGRKTLELAGNGDRVHAVFSPDGSRVAGVDYEHKVTVWDVVSGKRLSVIEQEGVQWAQFAPDGSRLFTAARNETPNHKSLLLTEWNVADAKAVAHREFRGDWQWAQAMSPDGKWLVLSQESGIKSLFDAQTGVKLRDLPEIQGDVYTVQFAGDGKTLLALDTGRSDDAIGQPGLVVWDTGTWQVTTSGRLPEATFLDAISSLRIAPDGRSFAHCDFSRGIRVWNVPPQNLPPRLPTATTPASAQHAGIADVDITCKYKGSAYKLRGTIIRRENALDNASPFTTTFQAGSTSALDYRFLSGLCADLRSYFNPFSAPVPKDKAAQEVTKQGFNQGFKANAKENAPGLKQNVKPDVKPEPQTLPSESSEGGTYRVVEALNPDPPEELVFGHGVPHLPRVRLRSYVDANGQVRRMVGEFQLFAPDGKTLDPNLLVMDATFNLREPNNSPFRPLSALPRHTVNASKEADSALIALAAAPAAPLLATADSVGMVTIWDANTAAPLRRLTVPASQRQALAFSQDGKRLASGSKNETLHIWDTLSGREVPPEGAEWRGEGSLALSPDGSLLATHIRHPWRTNDVAIWNVATGKLLTKLETAGEEQIVFSPDGKILAVRSSDDIGLWDTATWKRQAILVPTDFAVNGSASGVALAFSPDSRLLAIGDTRMSQRALGFRSNAQPLQPDTATSVQIWDMQTCQKVQTLWGTTGPVLALTFSPDGKTLAVVDSDKGAEGQGHNSAVLLWDTQTWRQVGAIAVDHGKPIERMAWTSDGAAIVTTYGENTLKFWDAPKR